MSFLVPTIRVGIVIALCGCGAFADSPSNRRTSTAWFHDNKASDAQPSSENKSANLPLAQLGMLLAMLPDRNAGLPSHPQASVVRRPDISVVPQNRSEESALPPLGAIVPNSTARDGDALPTPEPFNLPATAIQVGDVPARWAELRSRVLADEKVLASCNTNDGVCPPAARRFLSIVELGRKREGRAQLGWVNRAVNLSIRPMSDWAQYGYAQFWASPLQTLSSEAGDCKDYAIVKYVALRKLGIPTDDLRLVIVRDSVRQAEHEVVAVRHQNSWLILDNLTMSILDARQVAHYDPLFVMDHRGVRAFSSVVAHR